MNTGLSSRREREVTLSVKAGKFKEDKEEEQEGYGREIRSTAGPTW